MSSEGKGGLEALGAQIERLAAKATLTTAPKELGNDLFLEGGRIITREEIERREIPGEVPLQGESLDAFAEYIGHHEKLPDGMVIHVRSANAVDLRGPRLPNGNRQTYLEARWPTDPLDGQMGLEELRIGLLACTEDNEDRRMLLELLSQVRKVTEVSDDDDGLAQELAVKTGIRTNRTQKQAAPQTVNLECYYTFAELGAVQVGYRLRFSHDGVLSVRMIVADGGAWKVEARRKIAEYLLEHVKDDRVVVLY